MAHTSKHKFNHFDPAWRGPHEERWHQKDAREQTFFGYDGVAYADCRRKELLNRRIEVLENEIARLKKLRSVLLS